MEQEKEGEAGGTDADGQTQEGAGEGRKERGNEPPAAPEAQPKPEKVGVELFGGDEYFIIGLTGPFGSGSTTAANLLGTLGYHPVTLSAVINDELDRRGEEKTRDQMQSLGNELREKHGHHYLAEQALRKALADKPDARRIVLDGIRNTGEVRWLRDKFGQRFALFAIYAYSETRYQRVQKQMTPNEFYAADRRDQGEEEDSGQQVARCLDNADVFIPNDELLQDYEITRTLTKKLKRYSRLVEGAKAYFPKRRELLMNMAYSAAHGSKCLKRQVGAVIADGREPLATGYNENPQGMRPCIDHFGFCYRDQVRYEHFQSLRRRGVKCPSCDAPLGDVRPPRWQCEKCGVSLEDYFVPDRALSKCTALHAEERAIINAHGNDLQGTTLYTTTFPCMLCAEKIIHAGIKTVVFAEAYPDEHGRLLLKEAGVERKQFEGVRSRNFDHYFAGVRAAKEDKALHTFETMVDSKSASG